MNIGEKTNPYNEEYLIKTIKNINQQLNSLDTLHKKDKGMELPDERIKRQELNDSIEKLVGNLEEKSNTIPAYDAVPNVKDNNTLVISEQSGKVYLPYAVSELEAYMEEYPEEYKSLSDVVNQEYIVAIDRFKNPVSSRFRETYCLMRDIEMKSVITSFKTAVGVMFNSKLNPIIICACKSEEQLKKYIYCAERNKLDSFKEFKIVFEVSPFRSKYNNFEETFFKNNNKKSNKRGGGKHSK